MKITSPMFSNNQRIPKAYTCDGDRRLSPPLAFSDIPDAAKSLVLIVDDPDVPKELRPDGHFIHWVLFDIPPTTTELAAGKAVGTAGANTLGDARYTGPCPPPEYEPSTHRYVFRLYAIDRMLELGTGAHQPDVEALAKRHALATAELTGTYSRI